MPGQRLVVPEVYERCLAIPRKQHAAGRAKLAERAGNDLHVSKWGAVRHPVFTERPDVQVIGPGNLVQLVFGPSGHLKNALNVFFRRVTSGTQQRLNRAAFVHRAVALRHLIERQSQVEHLARIDLSFPHQID